jgi:hypothetical protein
MITEERGCGSGGRRVRGLAQLPADPTLAFAGFRDLAALHDHGTSPPGIRMLVSVIKITSVGRGDSEHVRDHGWRWLWLGAGADHGIGYADSRASVSVIMVVVVIAEVGERA